MRANDLADGIMALGERLASERNAAHDLWSWLPSWKVAIRNHHSYASNFTPSVAVVMIEAALYLAHLSCPECPLSTEAQERFTECPCGELHDKEAT